MRSINRHINRALCTQSSKVQNLIIFRYLRIYSLKQHTPGGWVIVLALWPKDVCFIFTQLLDFLSWLLLYLLFSKLCKSSLEVDKVLWARLKRYSWSNCYLLFVSKTFCNTLWLIVKDKKKLTSMIVFLASSLKLLSNCHEVYIARLSMWQPQQSKADNP